jgi:cell fate (sporulation/competence/biofilm development) regulator YmcA (YheA/YmcA/DUF963 family)
MNVQDALTKLPATIRATENELFDRKQEIEGYRHRLKMREADVALLIAKENAETKAYPNADARESELRRRLDTDPAAVELRRKLVEVEALQQRIGSTLTFYENTQRNARALCARPDPLGLIFAETI